MGLQLLLSVRSLDRASEAPVQRQPLVSGIALTAANPYFLIWWATVGLALATQSVAFGAAGLVLFTLAHWLCDFVWLEILSLAGFQGSERFGRRAQLAIALICGAVLLGFGIKFLYDAGSGLRTATTLAPHPVA